MICDDVACYRGFEKMVRLLLFYCGADATIRDCAGVSPADIAEANGHVSLLPLLASTMKTTTKASPILTNLPSIHNSKVTTLIPFSSQHAGAGSFMIDDWCDDSFLTEIDRIWRGLPVADQAEGRCSERRYYCDYHLFVSNYFTTRISSILKMSLFFHPLMRILHYPFIDGFVAAHVDLDRNHHLHGILFIFLSS